MAEISEGVLVASIGISECNCSDCGWLNSGIAVLAGCSSNGVGDEGCIDLGLIGMIGDEEGDFRGNHIAGGDWYGEC